MPEQSLPKLLSDIFSLAHVALDLKTRKGAPQESGALSAPEKQMGKNIAKKSIICKIIIN
jgi:hypothetical protein